MTARALLIGLAAAAGGPLHAAESPDSAVAYMQRHEGLWVGTFRRFDANGKLLEEFPSEIAIRLTSTDGKWRFEQTNRYRKPDGSEELIQSGGEIRDGRAWFASPSVEGWTKQVEADPAGRMGVLWMTTRDGSMKVHEVITLSDDGTRRYRVAQYLRGGRLWRRTVIDEALSSRAPTGSPASAARQ